MKLKKETGGTEMRKLHNQIGIYMRKEDAKESLKRGYGRLQWLRYELEDCMMDINTYIDEPNKGSKLEMIIKDIKKGIINEVILWSVDDLEEDFRRLSLLCTEKNIVLTSFCEVLDMEFNEMIERISNVA